MCQAGSVVKNTTKPPPQLPDPFETTQLVVAGPKSRIGYRCPTVRTAVSLDSGDDSSAPVEVTTTVELQLVDGIYPGRYVMTSTSMRPYPKLAEQLGFGNELSPERIRQVSYSTHIAMAAAGAMRLVVVDPATHTVVDHLDPKATLTELDDLVVMNWLQAKLCGLDPNKTVAAAMEELSATAVAQRIKRLRDAGVLLAAERAGRRR